MKKQEKAKKKLFSFQVDEHLRDTFLKVCENNDTTAAQQLRRMMREYIRNNQQGGLL